MKPHARKLVLNRETVRALRDPELLDVVGGALRMCIVTGSHVSDRPHCVENVEPRPYTERGRMAHAACAIAHEREPITP